MASEQADRWPQIREAAWQLLTDAARQFDSDPLPYAIANATTKIAIFPELAWKHWHRVMALGWIQCAAVAYLETSPDPESKPQLKELLAKDLYRRAETSAYAAHRANVPMAAALLAEMLTSLRLGERAMWRSIMALGSRSTADLVDLASSMDSRVLLAQVRAGLRAEQPSGEGAELNAWLEESVRQEFAASDEDRRGARVAMSLGFAAPLEAIRLSGRSLLYVGGGPDEGVAVLLDAAALSDPSRPIAGSISLPGVDIKSVEREVAGLHRAATDRRSRVGGRPLSEHVEQLLTWLGDQVWQPILENWPELSQRPVTVIPLGEFAQLPLYTATVAGRPACSVLDITIAPSARSLVMASEYPVATGRAFVAADPSSGDDELPYVVNEAEAVAAVYDTKPVILHQPAASVQQDGRRHPSFGHPSDESAEQELLSGFRSSAVVHLACHGILAPDAPLRSALSLGGNLTLETVLAQDLKPGCTVVLSACDLAGIGTEQPGEQLGFPAVLLAGGARTVVAALWPVAESPRTTRLMRRFHQELQSTTPTRALGTAIGQAVDSGTPASVWAPFTCFGA
ncbi:CHAT domain-containing protein [Actinoplanes sp. NPDC026670]|uniref:CHAT domain-containing protein n=1 Tax=Actinoplanes sp. NPDC026670 TaxID=3154700 RepID=UPI0033FE14DE